MLKTKIKAVVFDVGGVLSVGDYSVHLDKKHKSSGIHETMAKKLGIDLDRWFDSIDSAYARSITGEISGKTALSVMARNLDINKKKLEKLWIKTIRKFLRFNKKLYKYAKKLKKRGFKISILSDQFHISKKALINKKMLKHFSPVIISCDVGVRKPNIKIYKLLIKKLRLKPYEILFIDNREWNLKPAGKLGMKTVLFKDNETTIKKLNKLLFKEG